MGATETLRLEDRDALVSRDEGSGSSLPSPDDRGGLVKPDFLTEPTDQGLQYVIPGCEHDRARGPNQMDLFK